MSSDVIYHFPELAEAFEPKAAALMSITLTRFYFRLKKEDIILSGDFTFSMLVPAKSQKYALQSGSLQACVKSALDYLETIMEKYGDNVIVVLEADIPAFLEDRTAAA
jgi:hypothetical protein